MSKENRNRTNGVRLAALLFFSGILLCLSCSCGSGAGTGENSPVLTGYRAWGECLGGESDQFIVAELRFDRDVQISTDLPGQLRVVIGGKRIKADAVTAEQSATDAVTLRFPVDRVVDGKLKILRAPDQKRIAAITDADGIDCLDDLTLEMIVPSGVKIHAEGGRFLVDTTPTHRSIVWIRLRDPEGHVVTPGTGESVGSQEAVGVRGEPEVSDLPDRPGNPEKEASSGSENSVDIMARSLSMDDAAIMENAVGVHEHEFLWATVESMASDIADAINRNYGQGITASAEGNAIQISDSNGETDTMTLEIYEG